MSVSPPTLGAVAGLVTGLAVVAVCSLAGWTPVPGGEEATAGAGVTGAATPSSPAAEAFVAAWDRNLGGTWAVEGEFERTSRQGRGVLRAPVRMVQRPPDRLLLGFGSTESRLGGRLLSCATGPQEVIRCRDGGPAPPYEQERAEQVALFHRYVLGPSPLYTVAAGEPGCFELRLALPVPAPPYGDSATFCFDAATGALASVEIRRDEAVDVMRAVEIRSAVRDEELAPST